MKAKLLFLLGSSVVASGALLPSMAVAQTASDQPAPPERYQRDERGVDLVTGKFYYFSSELSIGDTTNDFGLAYSRVQRDRGYDDDYTTGLTNSGGYLNVTIGETTDKFSFLHNTSVNGTGATIATNAQGYVYTTADGVVYQFSASVRSETIRVAAQRVISIAYPNGKQVQISYDVGQIPFCAGGCGTRQISRVSAVTSNDGYKLLFAYRGGGAQDGLDEGTAPRWMTLAGVIATNDAEQNCTIQTCFLDSPTWERARYTVSGSVETRTDAEGRQTDLTYDAAGRIVAIRPAGYPANFITLAYDGGNRVTSYTKGGSTWQYSYTGSATNQTTVVTAPSGLQTVVTSNPTRKLLASIRVGSGGTTRYEYDSGSWLTSIISPEGNRTNYARDGRGNIVSTVMVGKSATEQMSTSATFAASCPVGACDKPVTTTDVRGQVTNYEYGPAHDQVTKIIYPSAGNGAPRRQKTFDYQQFYAWYLNSSGALAQSASPIWKLTRTTECSVATTCTGSADETVTEIAYGAPGQPNNLLPTSVTVRAGNNSIVATTTITYDRYGNPVTVDGPLAGTADTVTSRYNRMREVIGQVAAAPNADGSGSRRAMRITRDGAGRVSLVETGTVTGPGDVAWNALSVSQSVETQFDAKGRLSASIARGGGLYQLTDYAYDVDDRLRCTAGRSDTGSGGACMPINGTSPDNVRESVYGTDGRVTTEKQNGVAVATYGYTGNGQIASVTDAKSNVTSYQYDGFDRLLRTTFADQSYEYINRNGYGDATSVRQRDASSISMGRDLLGRVTTMSLPVGGSNSNISLGYDLFGRVTSASNGNGQAPWTNSASMAYDALGRMVSETSNPGGIGPRATAYQYDGSGNRTRITWADGFFASYEYRPDRLLQRIRENGGTVLAEYGYDALGRRTAISRGNGTSSAYGYDGLSRLTSLSHDLAGTAADVAYGSTYDNLSRITIQTRSNDSYAWTGQIDADRAYSSNVLNQYTQVGAGALGYDGRGNLTSDGNSGITYGYDALGHLTGSSSGAQLAYDALGRLSYTAVNGAGITRFGYADDQMIAEYDAGGNLVRRHVPSTGNDDPVVSYGPQGRSWLYADERGSIVVTADNSGSASQIMTYDEFGIPGGSYTSRFQYTGQAWLPELGMAHFKARTYSPTLGRFMQPDPIGLAGGMNLYSYVGADPVNNTDPTGLCSYINHQISVYKGFTDGHWGYVGAQPGSQWVEMIGNCGGGGGGNPAFTPGGGGGYTPGGGTTPAQPAPQNNQTNCPRGSLLGKLSALPTTLAGLAYGSVAGLLSKGPVSVSAGNNSIQISGINGLIGNRPVTIGNVQLYGVGDGPGSSRRSYDGQISNIGRHEQGHTYQAEAMGNGYLGNMIAAGAVEWLTGEKNPYETQADKFARSGCP